MIVEIPDHILQRKGLSLEDIKLRFAITLFQEEIFSLGQASTFAGISQFLFQRELAKRKIPLHYGVQELEKDVKTLKELFHDRRK